MTEIRISVQFNHPPHLVWRALTDRRLLSRWFMLTDLEPERDARFEFLPETLPGFDGSIAGEVLEIDPGRRLVMRWRGEQLHARVSWEVVPAGDGTLLVIHQSGFLGLRGTARRRQLVAVYRRLFGVRLLAVLDALATGADVAVPPAVVKPEPAPRPDRRRQLLTVLSAAVVIAFVAVLVGNLPRGASEPVAAQTASTPPAGAVTTAASRPGSAPPTRQPSAPVTSAATEAPIPTVRAAPTTATAGPATAPAAPAALSARYRTVSSGLLGYRGRVDASNGGGTAATGWTVTLTVAPLAVVSGVEGPPPEQRGTAVTFAGPPLAPGATARIVFDVALDATLLGPQQPATCRIDGRACAGL